MKITFLTPHINISGGIKIILGYADRLARRGHIVSVICPKPVFVRRRIKGFPVVYPKRALMNIVNYKPGWIECAASIKYVPSFDEKYIPDADIVLATAWQTASFVNDYSKRKGQKYYLIQGYEAEIFGSKEDVHKTYSYPMKKIVIASWLQDMLQEQFNEHAEAILNPIDLDVFYPTGEKQHHDYKRICMLDHTSKWKGIRDGIEAFQMSKQTHPNIRLVMFGAHNKEVNLECEYHYRPIGDRLRSILNSCDIFLCPSWREGFGLPSAEALACKCALVTADNGGSRDYAIHEKTALVSPPRNPEALAENLSRLLSSEDLLKRIAQNGYNHIRQFTWKRAVDKMERVFLQELEGVD